MLEATKRK